MIKRKEGLEGRSVSCHFSQEKGKILIRYGVGAPLAVVMEIVVVRDGPVHYTVTDLTWHQQSCCHDFSPCLLLIQIYVLLKLFQAYFSVSMSLFFSFFALCQSWAIKYITEICE